MKYPFKVGDTVLIMACPFHHLGRIVDQGPGWYTLDRAILLYKYPEVTEFLRKGLPSANQYNRLSVLVTAYPGAVYEWPFPEQL